MNTLLISLLYCFITLSRCNCWGSLLANSFCRKEDITQSTIDWRTQGRRRGTQNSSKLGALTETIKETIPCLDVIKYKKQVQKNIFSL